jgi:CBS domain containing-hemolysin-like protein
LLWLGLGALLGGLGAVVLPNQFGVTAGTIAALCVFLLVAATAVFVVVPGPGTPATLRRSVPLAGAVLVVAVLLVLANPTGSSLRWLWVAAAVAAAGWTAFAVWETRRSGG